MDMVGWWPSFYYMTLRHYQPKSKLSSIGIWVLQRKFYVCCTKPEKTSVQAKSIHFQLRIVDIMRNQWQRLAYFNIHVGIQMKKYIRCLEREKTLPTYEYVHVGSKNPNPIMNSIYKMDRSFTTHVLARIGLERLPLSLASAESEKGMEGDSDGVGHWTRGSVIGMVMSYLLRPRGWLREPPPTRERRPKRARRGEGRWFTGRPEWRQLQLGL